LAPLVIGILPVIVDAVVLRCLSTACVPQM
jgi:hypothetical protein